jgi:hypothetical protein
MFPFRKKISSLTLTVFDLVDEVERLRAEVRFLRDR